MRFILTLALVGSSTGVQAQRQVASRPAGKDKSARMNVLFITVDDLNTALGSYGHPLVKSPNIDRLATKGVRFDRAYCQFPLCNPSRASFMTGRRPDTTRVFTNQTHFREALPGVVTLPQMFTRQGYFAARVGKLYHYGVPNSIGTDGHDDPASWELEMNPAGVDRLEEHPKIFSLTPGQFGGTLSWYASPKSDAHHTDAKIAAGAEWILEHCAKEKDRPFFLAVGFFRPHTPYVSPAPYFAMHPEAKMPVAQAFSDNQPGVPKAALGSYKKEQDKLTDDLRRQARQAYNASISFMDAQVGRVMTALDRLGLAENTIIVFTSDHGYHVGEHGLWQKQSIFEESARVPLLVVAPGVSSKGGAAGAPVSHVDIFPTLAKLCGVKPPANLQGQSLVPILKDPAVKGRGWALTQVVRGGGIRRFGASPATGDDGNRFFGYSLRTPRWRYTEWDEGKQGRELYDHDADPKELTNLAEKTEHAATVTQLSEQLRAVVKTTFPATGETPKVQPGLWAPILAE